MIRLKQPMRIYVHIKPNSSPAGLISEVQLPAEQFGLFHQKGQTVSALKISVSSAPVDGQANEELIKILARHLAVPKSKLAIIHGLKGRFKVIELVD